MLQQVYVIYILCVFKTLKYENIVCATNVNNNILSKT